MKTRVKERRGPVAVLAALLLLAYSILAGFVDGAMAQPRLVDAFGNPICSAHAGDDRSGLPDQPGDHAHAPDCCFAGCNPAGGHALPPATQAFLLIRLVGPAPAILPGYGPAIATCWRSPLNPRAPPASA